MKIFRKILIVMLILSSAPLFSFGKKDSESDKEKQDQTKTEEKKDEKEEKPDDFVKIDLYLDINGENPKNHFNWKTKSATYKDYFDAVSGASKVHSTKYFREATLDSASKSLRVPKGLRNLCLFASSNPENLKTDDFKVERGGINGKKILITFTHREISYKIESDDNGVILVPGSFYIKNLKKEEKSATSEEKKPEETAEKIVEKEKSPPPENPKSEKTDDKTAPAPESEPEQKNENENPESPESQTVLADGFESDAPGENINLIYKGKLYVKLDESGILTIKGKAKLEKREEKKIEKEDVKDKVEKDDKKDNGDGNPPVPPNEDGAEVRNDDALKPEKAGPQA